MRQIIEEEEENTPRITVTFKNYICCYFVICKNIGQ